MAAADREITYTAAEVAELIRPLTQLYKLKQAIKEETPEGKRGAEAETGTHE